MIQYHATRSSKLIVILSTNVAETSLTLDGIGNVVDCGFQNIAIYNAKLRCSVLKRVAVSKANANQRAGRTGRTAPGVCYRLYTKKCFDGLLDSLPPEITYSSLEHFLLKYYALGFYKSPLELDLFKPNPPLNNVLVAIETLESYRFLNDDGSLSNAGAIVAKNSYSFYASVVSYLGEEAIKSLNLHESYRYWLGILILVLDTNDNHDMFKPLKKLPEKIRNSTRDARLYIIDQVHHDGNIFKYMICISRYFSNNANDLGLKSEKMQEYEQAFSRIRQRLSIFRYLKFELQQHHKAFLKTILMFVFKRNYAANIGLYEGYNERIFEDGSEQRSLGDVVCFYIEAESLEDGRILINSCFFITKEYEPELFELVEIETTAAYSDLFNDLRKERSLLHWFFQKRLSDHEFNSKSTESSWVILVTRWKEYNLWDGLLKSESAKSLFFNLKLTPKSVYLNEQMTVKRKKDGIRYFALLSLEDLKIHLVDSENFVWSTSELTLKNLDSQDLPQSVSDILVFQPDKCHDGFQAWIFGETCKGSQKFYQISQKSKSSTACEISSIALAHNSSNCDCSSKNLFDNAVVDVYTSTFVCICKHNYVYEGSTDSEKVFAWHLLFQLKIPADFSKRRFPVLKSIFYKASKTKIHRLVCIVGGYSYPEEKKLHDIWILNLDERIVIQGSNALLMHLSSKTHLVFFEKGQRLKSLGDPKSDIGCKLYFFNKSDGTRYEINFKLKIYCPWTAACGYYRIECLEENLISDLSRPWGPLKCIHSFVPRGTELVFFVSYTDNDVKRNKFQKFRFNHEHIEIPVHSEAYKLASPGSSHAKTKL